MKIGIITYHYGYNEGTLLQAYAVQTLLDRQFGPKSSAIVDHRYPAKEAIVFGSPATPRETALRKFFDEELHLDGFHNCSTNLDGTWQRVAANFDLLVVGSDELWRLDYSPKRWFRPFANRQTNPWAPAFPNVYWPDAAEIGVPCVSLAASISEKDQVPQLPRSHRRKLRRILQNFSLLTVRDSRTAAFVEAVVAPVAIKCDWMPDPTFCLEPPSAAALAAAKGIVDSAGIGTGRKRALILSHTSGPALTRAIEFFRSKGYLIVGLTHRQKGLDHDLSEASIGPLEWAALPALFDVVITDRFHGAVFALRNGTPVIALDYRGQRSGNDSKMKDLFKRFEVGEFWFSVQSGKLEDLDAICRRAVEEPWPAEGISATCGKFSARLTDFAAGPLVQLATTTTKGK